MKSLTEISLWTVVKRQYVFRLRSCLVLFVSLVIMQLISLLFAAGGLIATSYGMGWQNISLEIKFYSGMGLLVFTMLWILINSFILPWPTYRHIDFSFVTNRVSSNLANIGFLITAAIVGGITASFGSLLVRNIIYYSGGGGCLLRSDFWMSGGDLFISMAVGSLYLLLLSAIGYFLGVLMQLHRSLYIILPASLFGVFIYAARNNPTLVSQSIFFFTREGSPYLFVLKVMGSALLLWGGAVLLSNRAEVR